MLLMAVSPFCVVLIVLSAKLSGAMERDLVSKMFLNGIYLTQCTFII